MERWLSVDEIAAHLGVVRETVYRWIGRKALPAHRIGKFWRFSLEEVDEWARSSRPVDPVLAEIVERLVRDLRPWRIYLFGSRARGEDGPGSDYDLMVVVPDSDLPGYKRDQAAYRLLRGMGVAKDVMVWTRQEFESRLHLRASLPATVVREGRLLHAS